MQLESILAFVNIPLLSGARDGVGAIIAHSGADRFALYSDWVLFWFRGVLGLIFLVHGVQKLHFWRVHYAESLHKMSLVLFRVTGLVESVCAFTLFFGIFTSISSLLLIVIMLGAFYYKIVIWHKSFSGSGGWELDLLLLVSLFALFFFGAGAISYDRSLFGI